jgi:hypothetical protein
MLPVVFRTGDKVTNRNSAEYYGRSTYEVKIPNS